jgi:C-terminal processing protease CtpA/Prc
VLVDQNSASSTELLAAMLQDAGKALVIGAPSQGSGCGWTMPREDVTLTNSGAMLLIPDCARFRKDGRNELDGIEPDVLVGIRTYDTQPQRVGRLLAQLPATLNQIRGGQR